MASISCALTTFTVLTSMLLVSVSTTSSSGLTPPHCEPLFPNMCGQEIYHLTHYDMVLTARPIFPWNLRASPPALFCRYDDFYMHSLSQIRDADLGRDFHGPHSQIKLKTFFTGEPAGYMGCQGYIPNPPRFEQISSRPPPRPIPRQHLCIRRTYVARRFLCNNRIVQRLQSSVDYYNLARNRCRVLQGFDLPTSLDFFMYAHNKNATCRDVATPSANNWAQDDPHIHTHGRVKNFVCVGCHVHFNDLTGVKRIESNGTLVCKDGWYTDLPKPYRSPRCVNGHWDINTVGRCRQVKATFGRQTYFLLIGDDSRPVSSTSYDGQSSCGNANYPLPTSDHETNLLRQKILASWGTDASLWTSSTTYFTSSSTINQHTANQRHWTLCRDTCEFTPTVGFNNLDNKTGWTSCHNWNTVWRCEDGGCPRKGVIKTPNCFRNFDGRKRWNTARCARPDDRVIDEIARQRRHASYRLHLATAQFTCAPDHYQVEAATCGEHNMPCAGGPKNYPIRTPDVESYFVNLPSCEAFQTHRSSFGSGVHMAIKLATRAVSAEWARWVCKAAGMTLLSELSYSHLDSFHRYYLGEFIKDRHIFTIWIQKSNGEIGTVRRRRSDDIALVDPRPQSSTTTERHPFVCVKYDELDEGRPFPGYEVDFSLSPESERCADGYVLGKTGDSVWIAPGLEKCVLAG